MWKIRPPKLRLPARLPILTVAEKSALGILLVLLAAGAGLRAWERSGIVMGPVDDWDSLRRLVIRARDDQGDPVYACGEAAAFPSGESTGAALAEFPRTAPKTGASPTEKSGGKKTGPVRPVDLNTATEAQLHILPGVGPSTAKAILAWRAAHGKFASPGDLLNVKGIGPKKFEALRKFVRVAGSARKAPEHGDSGDGTASPEAP